MIYFLELLLHRFYLVSVQADFKKKCISKITSAERSFRPTSQLSYNLVKYLCMLKKQL